MALPRVYRVVQDAQGNIVPQVLGSVFMRGTGTLAQLYNDAAGTQPLPNPMTSDATYGSFKFYVAPGHYDLTFSKPGYTFEPVLDFQVPDDNVTLGTMATQDASAVAITGGTAAVARLGVGQPTPALPVGLDVAGQVYLHDPVGIGVPPSLSYTLVTNAAGPVYFPGPVGLGATPNAAYSLVLGPGNTILQAGGALGIGTPPGYTLHVQGSMGLNGGSAAIVNTTSRRALKQAIRPLRDALARLLRLHESEWEWADPALAALMPGTQMGLVTEDVAEDLPQWATQATDGTPGHHERGSLALVVGALRELTARLEALEARTP